MWHLEGYSRASGTLEIEVDLPGLDEEALAAILGHPDQLFGAVWPVNDQIRDLLSSWVDHSKFIGELEFFIVFLRP
ncbi:DUF7683 domain-containing protein [Isoptericola luteus]|uniref:DUF7683 domain-containing protein n=1 Tax=Isoptericola luteus TaxID=2879484 RepID=UPI003BF57CE5